MPPGAATHGNRCQTVAGRTHPWRGTRQRRRHFRRGVLAACGRARWKIENETFNVLKTNGYNLEHNFGHGKKTLASVLVTLNLLAFAFHTAAYLGVIAWRAAVIARGPTYRFFEHLRTITAYVVFPDWPSLLRPIAAAPRRPPCPEARLPPSRHSIHLNTEPKRRKTSTKSEFRIAAASVAPHHPDKVGQPLRLEVRNRPERHPVLTPADIVVAVQAARCWCGTHRPA